MMQTYQRPDDENFYQTLRDQGKTPDCRCPMDWRYDREGRRYPALNYILSCPVHYPRTSTLFKINQEDTEA